MILRHGWRGQRMLDIMVSQYRRQQLWQAYTATVLGMIGKIMGGENWKLQSYVEMVYPGRIETDTRSAEQIKEDIVKRLRA